jgi:uncharacterized protein Yka (UPF0111/DUF47 family)
MIDREDILEAIQQLDDPEDLVADLIYEATYSLETGDFTGLEELLQGVDEMIEIRDSTMVVKSWREFYSDEE